MRLLGLVLVAWACATDRGSLAGDPVTYNRDILPILAEHCFACHGFDKATRQAGLRLDRADMAMQPLADGQRAIVPGSPAESLLLQRITAQDDELRMPPPETGKRLDDREAQLLRRWIADGAKYETHWAFLPPTSTPATLKKLPSHLQLQEQSSSTQPPQAQHNQSQFRLTQLRRLSLDLTGLPPTADLVRAFAADESEDAYERMVDRLLASPRFGERWARWWLDLAHYADSDGYLQDFLRPHAWHYRDWVVAAFNADMPFDQFTVHQLAGDLLADERDREQSVVDMDRSDAQSKQMRIATGFLRNTLSNREGGADLEEYRVRQAIDRTATVATTWLGLTVGCAECHDHKYDPITQREFYQFYALFNNIDEVNIDVAFDQDAPTKHDRLTSYELSHDKLSHDKLSHDKLSHDKWDEFYRWRTERLRSVAEELDRLQNAWEEKLLFTEQHPGADHRWDRELEVLGLIWGQGEGEGQLEGINIIKTARARRTQSQQARLQDYFFSRGAAIDTAAFKRLNVSALHAEIQKRAAQLPKAARAQTVVQAIKPRTTYVHTRGDFRRPGDVVQPGVPVAVSLGEVQVTDRLALAQWLTLGNHPLTSRVVVNRLWQELFGVGLVATSENFGIRGGRPTRPELLDYLAVRLVEVDWSLKAVLREIVMSDVYLQSSDNVQWPRDLAQRRLRMSAESVRDAMLLWGGLLDARMGGPAVRPTQPESVAMEGFDNKWIADEGADRYRRGLYTFLQRTSPFAQSITFDLPDTSRSCSRRERSNTPLQALTLLNDPVLFEAALGAAWMTQNMRTDERPAISADRQRMEELFLSILSRWPTRGELDLLEQHLKQQRQIYTADTAACEKLLSGLAIIKESNVVKSELAAWAMTASVLMNLDEAITRN